MAPSGSATRARRIGLRSLRFRIVALFVAALLALFGALAFLLWQQQRTAGSLEVLTQAYLPLSKVAARLDRDRQRVGNDLDRIMRDAPRPGTGAESPTVIYTEAFQRNLIYGRTYAEKARALAPSSEERAVLNKVETHLARIDERARRWEEQSRQLVELAESGRAEEAKQLATALRGTGDSLGTEIEQLVRLVDGRINAVTLESEQDQLRGVAVAVALSAVALVLAIVLVGAVVAVVRPIGRLTEQVQRLAAGERIGKVEVRGGDEVAVLAYEFDQMAQALRERDQRLTERADQLRRLSRYLGSVVDSLQEALIVVEGGEVTLANPAASRTFGVERSVEPPEILADLPPGRHEVELDRRRFEIRIAPFGDGGAIIVGDDVTEQTATRERLARSERLAVVGQMLAQITHEVRNPLNALSLNAELMADELASLDAERHTEAWDLLGTISTEIDRLTEVTGHYLQLARRPPAALAEADLGAIVEDVARLVRPELEQEGVGLTLDVVVSEAVLADGNQLRQALLNVLRNAVEAGAKQLRLSVTADDDEVRLELADDGPGMSAEEAERAFDPFWSSKATGTGLGLAITKQILEDHGGRVEVASESGAGTTVVLVLPRMVLAA